MPPGLGQRLLGSLLLGVVVAAIVAVMAVFLLGRPPKTFSMAAGPGGGMYQRFAADLKAELQGRGFQLEVIETDGSIENAQLVRDDEADIALVQSGTEILTEVGDATALAEVFYEPLFIFAQGDLPIVDGVPSLRGARINIGPAGSGTNALAQGLITLAGIPAILTTNETADSVDMLREGTIDAAVFVVAPFTCQFCSDESDALTAQDLPPTQISVAIGPFLALQARIGSGARRIGQLCAWQASWPEPWACAGSPPQNSALPGVRGKGMTSRMLAMPVA